MALTRDERLERARIRDRARRKDRRDAVRSHGRTFHFESASMVTIPQSTADEADRLRQARRRQDWAGYLTGDPPPGFSALDQRLR